MKINGLISSVNASSLKSKFFYGRYIIKATYVLFVITYLIMVNGKLILK